MGDYTNLSITLDVDLSAIPTTLPTELPTEACIPLSQLPQDGPLPDSSRLCQDALDAINDCLAGLRRGDATACLGLPPSVIDVVCDQFPVPGCAARAAAPPPRCRRPACRRPRCRRCPRSRCPRCSGRRRTPRRHPIHGEVPRWASFTERYDPALVSLLVPGMVTR